MSDTNISDAAVKRATGKTWRQWLVVLDRLGARRMGHKEIVRLLQKKHRAVSEWWSQMITVEYERRRGKRAVGQVAGVGWQIGVQRTLPMSARRVWKLVTGPAGRRAWLGEARRWRMKPGATYRTKEGAQGEIRTTKPGKMVRLTWQPRGWREPSTVQVYVMAAGRASSSVRFHQEKLTSRTRREQMRRRWTKALDMLEDLARS